MKRLFIEAKDLDEAFANCGLKLGDYVRVMTITAKRVPNCPEMWEITAEMDLTKPVQVPT